MSNTDRRKELIRRLNELKRYSDNIFLLPDSDRQELIDVFDELYRSTRD